ncbi:hypothetical protein [Leptolyngbya sp. FACHB-261]|uniref:hypothetical protein n=1 Tax=Leptolyngbya sp. FACHB-261 TaxID=2692806 RepID=UPI001682CF56|nr:hypothetical protein [Leptolyngbya sp. FACHB-261]MBD2101658.1 hypothetical protein [Leptolyngbya sp. FACHB-261]
MTSDTKLNTNNVPHEGDVNIPRLSTPRPGQSAKLIDPNDLPDLLGKLKAGSVNSYRPPTLPVELASSHMPKSPAASVVARSNPGTPAPSTLFDAWPWSTMGKVFVGRTNDFNNAQFTGSGVLVGRHTLLTASHVVPWEWVSSGDWWVRFVPAYFHGVGRYGDSYVSGWYGFKTDSVEGDDYVVCDLYENLGDQCGWLGVISLKESRYDDFVYTSVGYPGDVQNGQVPCVEYGLTIQDVDDEGENAKELETRLFGGKGWSGGPLFSDIDGGTLIVGVRSGRETDFLTKRRVVHASGRKLVDIVRYAHENWKRSEWSGWQALGGSFPAGVNPAAVSRNSSSIELFCRSHDNAVWQTFRQPDGNWSGWFQIPDPGDLIGDLAVVSMSPDNLQLFGVGTDSQMWTKWWTDAGGWSGWQALGGSFPAGVNPAAVSRSSDSIELFCRSHDNHIWQTFRQPDGNWSGWFQIPDPGDLIGDLAVVSMSPDNLQLFGVGTDSQMWTKWWTDAGGWSEWQALGGSFPAGVNPAAVSRSSDSIELFCRSHDNHIWQTFRQPDGNWSGWFQIPDPGDLIGDLAVVSMSPDNLQLFGIGTDSQMWSKWWARME